MNENNRFSVDHTNYHLPPISLTYPFDKTRIPEHQRLPSFNELNDMIFKNKHLSSTKRQTIVDATATKRLPKQHKVNKQTKTGHHYPIGKPRNKCQSCHSTETPEWRKGPLGPRTLCNACGLIWIKLRKNELQKISK